MKPLSRRRFVQSAALGAASAGVFPPCLSSHAAQRPNLLLILVDDLGKEWLSCYGAQEIETPHIDALAEGGLVFENAYSMPQCTPSRVSLLTGQYPFRTGWVNHWDVPRWGVGYFDWQQNVSFPRALRDAGYATAAAGKWQINDFRLEPEAMRKHGFDDWCMWTGYETGNPPSGKRYWDPYLNTPAGSRTDEGEFGPQVFTDFLTGFMEEHRDEPLFLYFPMALTHTPLINTPLDPQAEGKLARHKAMVRYMDHCVGQLVAKLEQLGIRERTLIVFTTDNGSTRSITGTRNGVEVAGAKAQKTEAGVCAPFIVNAPGLVPPGKTDALTDFTDLAPTFCELAGAQMPDAVKRDGVSIAPLLRGQADDTPREWILAMGHGPAILDEQGVRGVEDFASRVIRNKRYKAWVNTERAIERLYDLQADPFEQHNLLPDAADAHAVALNGFRRVVESLPAQDARPQYRKRAPNPWDKQKP